MEERCDEPEPEFEPEPARLLPVLRPRSIKVKSDPDPVVAVAVVVVVVFKGDFSMRRRGAAGGEYCVPTSTMSRATGLGRDGLGLLDVMGEVRRVVVAGAW